MQASQIGAIHTFSIHAVILAIHSDRHTFGLIQYWIWWKDKVM